MTQQAADAGRDMGRAATEKPGLHVAQKSVDTMRDATRKV